MNIFLWLFLICAGTLIWVLASQKKRYEHDFQKYLQARDTEIQNRYAKLEEDARHNFEVARISEQEQISKLQKEYDCKKELLREDYERKERIERKNFSEKQEFFKEQINSLNLSHKDQLEILKDELEAELEKEKEKMIANIQIEAQEVKHKLELENNELKEKYKEEQRIEKEKLDLQVRDTIQINQEQLQQTAEKINEEVRVLCEEREKIRIELNDFKKRRDAINQAILTERALEEKQSFYQISISENDWADIHFLLSIVEKFTHKEAIYKLIWSEYLQKPFKQMINRVLSNKEPRNVIYTIQNIETKEMYIGKTQAEVSKRWTEHIKSSLNIGNLSSANIHKALFNNWDKFAFMVLEEVAPDQNLSEKEKFYIDMYQSNIYGYNIKAGG